MSGETENDVSGLTTDTLKAFNDLRFEMQAKYDDMRDELQEKFLNERDRRYTEVKAADAMALKIKEQADRDAAGLERENRAYKDEKANNLREQIGGERGLYALKTDVQQLIERFDLSLKPINDYISGTRGKVSITGPLWGLAGAVLVAVLAGLVLSLSNTNRDRISQLERETAPTISAPARGR